MTVSHCNIVWTYSDLNACWLRKTRILPKCRTSCTHWEMVLHLRTLGQFGHLCRKDIRVVVCIENWWFTKTAKGLTLCHDNALNLLYFCD